jgi:hemolysin III
MFRRSNTIPNYTLGEELINSISHGVTALIAIFLLVFMMFKCNNHIEYITCAIFGTSMITLYSISSIYHALSPKINAKKILRVLDHSNVYLLVFGTYIPISLLSIGGLKSILLVTFVGIVTLTGIVLTCIDIDKFQISSVICHLLNGWSAVIGLNDMFDSMGFYGVLFLVLGGIMYSIGAILYGIGSHVRYMHSVFHFFCIAGTIFHFLTIYLFIL